MVDDNLETLADEVLGPALWAVRDFIDETHVLHRLLWEKTHPQPGLPEQQEAAP